MAEINKIKVAGTDYDVRDSGAARTNHTHNDKVTEPTTEGTSGQVLTTDGNGGRTWSTVGGGGAATWGSITGTLSNQTDLSNALAKKVETTNDSQSLILGKDSSGFYYLG